MENKEIISSLKLLTKLMELHEENPFKVKSVQNAVFNLDKFATPFNSLTQKEIENLPGVGKGIAAKIIELVQNNHLTELDDLINITPSGIIEILGIKGLGPKKVATIWQDLNIETVGELYYACNENRLIEAKGFGLKTQEEIKKKIEFMMAGTGWFHYASIEPIAYSILKSLETELIQHKKIATVIEIAGDFRRNCEVLDRLIYLINTNDVNRVYDFLTVFTIGFSELNIDENRFTFRDESGIIITLQPVQQANFPFTLFTETGSKAHVEEVLKLLPDSTKKIFETEEQVYLDAGLTYILPELRENTFEIEAAKNHKLPQLLNNSDLLGTLHNHSIYSDGANTLSEMANACIQNGLQYFGICDHSKSAFYAKGMKEDLILAQHAEIEKLNLKLAPFKLFKGIESDILNDGSLDYSNEILSTFDFVVASVHSNLKMDEQKANARLKKAIENPFTTILGHPTGRLLLVREGYKIDHAYIIDCCASNNVIIELNANPLRLDMDWRWIHYAINKGVKISINPDAHKTSTLADMRYGVLVARKAGLTAEMCFNTLNVNEMDLYFSFRKRTMEIK